jgi:hypothetical protein
VSKLSQLSLSTLWAAAALFVYIQIQFWNLPSGVDHASWDYMSQIVARGGVPYRDAVDIKAPLSAYIGAAAIAAGHLLVLRDIFAIRLTYIVLAALTVAFTLMVTYDYFSSKRVAVLAAAIMLSFDLFGYTNSLGVEPKTSMVLFGLLALWAVYRDRPFLAGLFGMLSALSWQRGLLFVGVALVASTRYLTCWRGLRRAEAPAGRSNAAREPSELLLGGGRTSGLVPVDYSAAFHRPRRRGAWRRCKSSAH